MVQALLASKAGMAAPRSDGRMLLSTKSLGRGTGIDRFRTSGAMKVAFPRRTGALEAIMVNTSGGLTGGDRFETQAAAGPQSHLVLTTQAAERAYRSQSGAARVTTRLSVAAGARLDWLPQELIFFDGGALDRRLEVDLAPGAELVLVEPIVFGRRAMGECTLSGTLRDRITLRRQQTPLYWDRIALDGALTERLARPGIAAGMTAMASALYHGPRAEALLDLVRPLLPSTGGASLIQPDLLCLRLLASDGFELRQSLLPLLEHLTKDTLPKSWSL